MTVRELLEKLGVATGALSYVSAANVVLDRPVELVSYGGGTPFSLSEVTIEPDRIVLR